MDKKWMSIGTGMMLLQLLSEQDMYGYQMIKELENRSQSIFALKEGTLYPLLHTLEQQSAITSYEKTAENGRQRKYYQITTAGKKILNEKKKDWETYQKGIGLVMGGEAGV